MSLNESGSVRISYLKEADSTAEVIAGRDVIIS